MTSLRNILAVSALSLATSTFALASDSASGAIKFKDAKGTVKYGFWSAARMRLGHLQSQVGKKVRPGDEAEELRAIHHDRDPAAIEHA